MGRARDVQPHLTADLVITDDFSDAGMENFRAATGQRIDPSLFELQKRFSDRQFRDAGEVADLNHGKGLQMHRGAAFFQPADEIQEIVEG